MHENHFVEAPDARRKATLSRDDARQLILQAEKESKLALDDDVNEGLLNALFSAAGTSDGCVLESDLVRAAAADAVSAPYVPKARGSSDKKEPTQSSRCKRLTARCASMAARFSLASVQRRPWVSYFGSPVI